MLFFPRQCIFHETQWELSCSVRPNHIHFGSIGNRAPFNRLIPFNRYTFHIFPSQEPPTLSRMTFLRGITWICIFVCAAVICQVTTAERTVSWEALEAALREAEREAAENELYGNGDERDKRGPMNFRFRGAKRNADETPSDVSLNLQEPASAADANNAAESSRPKRSPLQFRFRGAKRAPSSSGFFGMRGKKDEWDSLYDRYEGVRDAEEKRGPLNFRFRGA
ncbi:hypothetical protein BV898_08055 [Hypsibius exemplaris]|uniref:Uncharacterized protein n=1 Tax=Hypsibius exemplaris TaxID=2072580 RepID=A0A1W0WRU0_HYPEX|nr:hypothetical protein BV898_08055 [Hypsibius exemplaris]